VPALTVLWTTGLVQAGEPDIKWISERIQKMTAASEKDLQNGVSGDEIFWFFERQASNKEISVATDNVWIWVGQDSREEIQKSIRFHFLLSAAQFRLTHKEQSTNREAIDIAGLEGVARAYENLIQKDSGFRTKNLDGLLTVRNEGRLPDLVKKLLTSAPKGKS
jgi:hypothetical protein